MNKPVAWMQVHHKDNKPTKFSLVQTWEDDIPLYTYLVKELTNEEINDIYDEWQALSGDPVKLYELFKLKAQDK